MDVTGLITNIVAVLAAIFGFYKWFNEKALRKRQESKADLEIIKDYQAIATRISEQFNEASLELSLLRNEVSTLKIEKNSCQREIEQLRLENKELKLMLKERGLI